MDSIVEINDRKGAETVVKDNERKFEIKYMENFLSEKVAEKLFKMLILTAGWVGEEGRRMTLSLGKAGLSYRYNNMEHKALEWDDEMVALGEKIMNTEDSSDEFNFALCNWYENGNVGLGFHADNESDIEENSIIASISLGETRRFKIKENNKPDNDLIWESDLTNGSLLIMKGTAQKYLKHAIAKEQSRAGPRLNITFRIIKDKRKKGKGKRRKGQK